MPSRSFRRSRRPRVPQQPSRRRAGSLLRFVLTVAILAWVFRSFVAAPFNIPSGSMLPTLYIGDYLVVSKWPYGYSRYSFPFAFPAFKGRIFASLPKRGDVVVFRHPSENSDLIKRVIGIPGDTRRSPRRQTDPQRPRRASAGPLPPAQVPLSANSPCRAVPPATPPCDLCRGTGRSAFIAPSSRLCPVAPATPCSTRSIMALPTISPRPPSLRATFS